MQIGVIIQVKEKNCMFPGLLMKLSQTKDLGFVSSDLFHLICYSSPCQRID